MELLECQCRYCRKHIGRFEKEQLLQISSSYCHSFEEELSDFVNFIQSPNQVFYIVCEDCEMTLSEFPHYHEYKNFIN
ncbi:anti-sigma-F factor Fin [Gottfriedia luciferensis]|uniref:anti-sigma-F factor Fin n=1 Tax=Gottfriedia luciferensis TaxID=178774 RepID=UPI0013022134|nr:anti-sigma-F factor Fin [Gottfriedia luciferensis]